MEMLPDVPAFAAPVEKTKLPLAPDDPAFWVASVTAPLVEAVP
jgi:hypothetical protein